jgi:hypothetical protein
MPPEITVHKVAYWTPMAVGENGTPLHNGEPMTEIEPGRWVTPLAAAALALFAEAAEEPEVS